LPFYGFPQGSPQGNVLRSVLSRNEVRGTPIETSYEGTGTSPAHREEGDGHGGASSRFSDGAEESLTGVRGPSSTTKQKRHDLWGSLGDNPLPAVLVGILTAAILGVIGIVAVLSGRTVYTSQTTMLIDDPYLLATAGQPGEYGSLSALRYKYAALVNTDPIAQPVAEALHLPVNDVIGALSTSVPSSSLLMQVEATWSSPRGAQIVSEAAANQVTKYVESEDSQFSVPAIDRFTFDVVDPATAALAQPPSKSKAIALAIGLAILGFALGFFVVQLARYLS
jgi:capsular polysaccharide biosynthesis protein